METKLIGKEDGFLETLWEGFVGVFKFILKNQGTNTLATKAPIEGDLTNSKTKIWPTVFNIFKNGWISAFKGEVDEDIEYKDVDFFYHVLIMSMCTRCTGGSNCLRRGTITPG